MEIEYEEVDREETPLGELVLRRYRAETGEEGYEILIDDTFLMASPGWLATPGNAGLYDTDGVTFCRRALAPGGVLAVWSPQPNPAFESTLRRVFPTVDVETTTDPDEPSSTIYLGRGSFPGLRNC